MLDIFSDLYERNMMEEEIPRPTQTCQEPSHKGCKCSKIGCLKLYCECFEAGRVCGQKCLCKGCKNTCSNLQQISQAKKLANQRKPGHFKCVKKCKCRKSKCLKKYCECYNAGLKCGPWCKCEGCSNYDPDYIPELQRLVVYAY